MSNQYGSCSCAFDFLFFVSFALDLAYVVPGKNIPIAAEALSVGYKHSVDIYSCSFSRGVDGKSIYKIPFALRHTMEEGAKSVSY